MASLTYIRGRESTKKHPFASRPMAWMVGLDEAKSDRSISAMSLWSVVLVRWTRKFPRETWYVHHLQTCCPLVREGVPAHKLKDWHLGVWVPLGAAGIILRAGVISVCGASVEDMSVRSRPVVWERGECRAGKE